MSALEALRRAIRQQTESIGQPVTNLIGPVAELGLPLEVTSDSAWLLLRLPGTQILTPDEYYARYATIEDRRAEDVPAKDGLVIVLAATPTVFLLRGVADIVGTYTAPIEIATSSGQGEWAIYVDGNLARRGSGSREFSLSLTEGRHIFEIICAATGFALQFPPGLRIQPIRDVLTAPIWHSVETDYADRKAGTPAVHLKWFNNPRVGGWSILRRELEPLAPIIQLGLPNASGEFGLAVPTDVVSKINLGAALYAGFEHIGQALTVDFSATASITFGGDTFIGITSIKAQLPAGRLDSNEFWLGRTLGTGVFRELTRVQRTGLDQLVPYDDLAVQYGAPYEYALQAYGLFDPTALSPLSEIRYVRAGDTEPPGSIQIQPGYPQQINGIIRLQFETPADEDYAGVRAFFRHLAQVGNVATSTTTTITLPAPVTVDPKGYIIEIKSGPNAGQIRRIAGLQEGSSATLLLEEGDSWFQTTPTTESTFEFYNFLDVVTDHGLPNTTDQFAFDALPDPGDATKKLKGLYYFPTFDLAGNLQDMLGGEVYVFDYDPDNDTFDDNNQPPVVGIRQLRPIEQRNNFTEPFNDTTNWAIVELTASDPVDDLEGVIIEYRKRQMSTGTVTGTGPSTLSDATQTWVADQHRNYLVQVTSSGEDQSQPVTLGFVAAGTVANVTIPLTVRRFDGGSGSVLVSNGIPLQRGQLLLSDLPNVAVTVGGVEQAIYIEALPGKYVDGSLRSVLVQFNRSLSTPVAGALVIGTARTVAGISKTFVSQARPVAVALPSDVNYLHGALEAFAFQPTLATGVVGAGTGVLPYGIFELTNMSDTRFDAAVRSVAAAGALALLAAAQAAGKKLLLDLGQSTTAINADGTFNQALWQSRIDAYSAVDLSPYITSGTLAGHFVVDQPQAAARWGGTAIPHATIEALAAYSKTKWPTLETYARVPPNRLLGSTWTALDNAWAQYGIRAGDVELFRQTMLDAAKSLGLGLVWGLNVLNAGTGTAGTMTPEEIRTFGAVLATEPYSKGFYYWSGDPATDWTTLNGAQTPAIADVRGMQQSVFTGTTAHTTAETQLLDYEARHWWCFNNNGSGTTCSGLSGAERAARYNKGERARNCFVLWARTGDTVWFDRAFRYLDAYRTSYWIGNVAPPENMVPEGIMAAYWLSGFEGWKTGLLTNYRKTYASLPPETLKLPGLTAPVNDGRAIARALLCCFFGALTGDTTVVPRTDGRTWSQLVDLHFEIPLSTQRTDGSYSWRIGVDPDWGLNDPGETGTSNYQLAQLALAMITVHEHFRADTRTGAYMGRVVQYLESQWRSGDRDWRFHSGRVLLPSGTGNWDLNAMVAAPYAWYAATGQAPWRARVDEALAEANTRANLGNNAGLDGSGNVMASTGLVSQAYYAYGTTRNTSWIGALTSAAPIFLALFSESAEGIGIMAAGAIQGNTGDTLTLYEPWIMEPAIGSSFEIAWVTNMDAGLPNSGFLDDPMGTRSRNVAVLKTENSNHFQVRAKDKDGLYSDILSYTPDFDSIPEISDLSSRLDTVSDITYVTGTVDDDCGSFEYWFTGMLEEGEATEATPNKELGADTSQQKAFAFSFPLPDGTRRVLHIRPYSLPNQTGVTGPPFEREFTRFPNTSIHWEDKELDQLGRVRASATSIMLTFEVSPTIDVVWGDLDDQGQFTKFLESANRADLTITDTDAGWVPGQFRPDAATNTQYWARVKKPGSWELFAKIADNTGTELMLAGWFDTQWWGDNDPASDGTWPLQVRAGVTRFKHGLNPGEGSWIYTFDSDFIDRNPTRTVYVDYHTLMSGVPDEPIKRWKADPDDLPSFDTLEVTSGVGSVTVRIDAFDDDTKTWICFGRKGRSPTKGEHMPGTGTDGPQGGTNGTDGQLDIQYRKFEGFVDTATQFEFNAGDGTWWITACPINSKGQYGPCRSDSVDVLGGGPISGQSAQLLRFTGGPADRDATQGNPGVEGENAYNFIRWEHNDLADATHPGVTMKLFAVRQDLPGQEAEISAAGGPGGTERRPWQDCMRGNSNTLLYDQARSADIDEVGSDFSGVPYSTIGSFLHLTGDKRGLQANGAVQKTWIYRALVYEDGLEVQSTPVVSLTSWIQSLAIVPHIVGPLTVEKVNDGACAPGTDGVVRAQPGIQFRLRWGIDPLNETDYFLNLDVARNAAGDDWVNIDRPSAGIADGNIVWSDPQLVLFQPMVLNNYPATLDLQFPPHPVETGTTNTGDGIGYVDLRTPGGNPVLTSVMAGDPPPTPVALEQAIVVTATQTFGPIRFPAPTPIGPSPTYISLLLQGFPIATAGGDFPLRVRNVTRGFDLVLYTGQFPPAPAYQILGAAILILPSRQTLDNDTIEVSYSYRDEDLSGRRGTWKVIDTAEGTLRIWNELATTTGQDILLNGTCDATVEGAGLKNWKFRLQVIRQGTAEVLETSETQIISLNAGICAQP